MRDIDQMIRDTLPAADVELFERLGREQGIQEMVIDSFRGRMRWLVTVVFVTIPAFVVVAVLAAIQFFQVESVNEMIVWACGGGHWLPRPLRREGVREEQYLSLRIRPLFPRSY